MLDDVDHELREFDHEDHRCANAEQDQVEVYEAFQHGLSISSFLESQPTPE
jgi:hypothetical protein